MTFEEILQDIVNQDDETKIKMAVSNYSDLLATFKQFDPETEGMIITYAILGTAVAADGVLTPQEYEFVEGLLEARGMHHSREEILDIIKSAGADRGAYGIVKDVRDHLNDEGANKLLTMIAAICSLDDRISSEEVAYIRSLL